MYNIIPLILIIISLIIIITIVAKKFSALASLDVASIQSEREAIFKERIISNRLKRNYYKFYSKFLKFLRPVGEALKESLKNTYKRLVDFKDNYNNDNKSLILNPEEKINKLQIESIEMIKKEDFNEAEKRLIEIISLDTKNIKAFRSLGELYLRGKKFVEAEQTFSHVLKLIEREAEQQSGNMQNEVKEEMNMQTAEIYFDLAEALENKGSLNEAIKSIDAALEIMPNNPRYLDTKVEISIMKKDKKTAQEAFEKLSKANPENQKLIDFRRQIEEL